MTDGPTKRKGAPAVVTHRGYHPHFHHPDAIQHVTFRLADSVPAAAIDAWRREFDMVDHAMSPDGSQTLNLQAHRVLCRCRLWCLLVVKPSMRAGGHARAPSL